MAQKKISIKGLADFMTASATRQRSVLRQFKYPQDDEAQAKIIYYREARDRLAIYHQAGHPRDWLQRQAEQLETLGSSGKGRRDTRLRHNARALRAYAARFSDKNYEMLNDLVMRLVVGDVIVTVATDLHVREDGDEKVIKLEFSVAEPSEQLVRIMCQTMFEATEVGGLGLSPSNVLLVDVERGREYKGARMRSRLRSEIQSACLNISAIWNEL